MSSLSYPADRRSHRVVAQDVQDTREIVEHLHTALALDDPSVFVDHVTWRRDVLRARGEDTASLAGRLAAVRDELAGEVSPRTEQLLDRYVQTALAALEVAAATTRRTDTHLSREGSQFLEAIVDGRREAALGVVLEALARSDGARDVYVDVVQGALREVGLRWERNELTVADEHLATVTARFVVSVLNRELARSRPHGGVAIVTGVRGDTHDLGGQVVANVLEQHGWDARFIGTDLPHQAIVAAIKRSRADLVAISVTLVGRLADARDLIADVRRDVEHPVQIIVGGAAFTDRADLWQALGADGYGADVNALTSIAAPSYA